MQAQRLTHCSSTHDGCSDPGPTRPRGGPVSEGRPPQSDPDRFPGRDGAGGFRLLEDPLTDHLIATRHRRDALDAARELTLATLRLTRHPDPSGANRPATAGEGAFELLSDLRRAAAGVALGLETATAKSLTAALRWLWQTSDLVDRAEQAGLLEMDQAVELLTLGSRVEVPLVVLVRKYGAGEV